MKGLLIAYSFAPNKRVGALRPTYWAEEMERQHGVSIDVITATDPEGQTFNFNHTYIPNSGKGFWSFLIKDEGLTWRNDVLNHFKKNPPIDYDFVLFTGGPFFHFSLGKYFKSFGLKVIYDFRDPFSNNPRFGDGGLKKYIKTRFERKCLKSADLVVTVNAECHELIDPTANVKRAIVANGYDERVVPEANSKGQGIFYAGRFYWEPTAFFSVLEGMDISLMHAGVPHKSEHPYVKSNRFDYKGLLTQKAMYAELQKAEIGVVFTVDIPFESTTKIYDYIALGKKMLIVTQGEPNRGALLREMKQYPNHRWVRNEEEEIRKALEELIAMDTQSIDPLPFSRKQGLKLLVNEIKAIHA